jgi:hypothetical protein
MPRTPTAKPVFKRAKKCQNQTQSNPTYLALQSRLWVAILIAAKDSSFTCSPVRLFTGSTMGVRDLLIPAVGFADSLILIFAL